MIRQMHADLMLAVNNFLTHFETFCNTSGLTEQLIYQKILLLFLKIGPTPASFSFIFGLFKQTIQFLQQINVKKRHVHPVYGAGIQTHDLQNVILLP